MMSLHDSAVEKWHDYQAASEHEHSRFRKIEEYFRQSTVYPESSECKQERNNAPCLHAHWISLDQHRNYATEQKQPDDLLRSPCRGDSQNREDSAKQFVLPECEFGEFEGGPGNDPDHGCADSVEHTLHPRQSAKADVSCRQSEHHQEGRQHKRHSHCSSSWHA